MFDQDTVYIIGEAKSPANNPITEKYKLFFIGMVIDAHSGKIVDVECSSILNLTNVFIRSLFVGRQVEDEEAIVASIERRYLGSSQKALTVAYRNVLTKYRQQKES
ncbi:DUF3870 domain-containing protein [Shouchella shacheensis]|uniref:DUF3870 domain-containing protein n=1 Tax=Shouchella shacheensis TaxID=1649580 RepID=UPI00073FAC91|nr:DUF3870 domain-containing protein [Shouchella shacheensis]